MNCGNKTIISRIQTIKNTITSTYEHEVEWQIICHKMYFGLSGLESSTYRQTVVKANSASEMEAS